MTTDSLPPSPHAKPPNRIVRSTGSLAGIVLVLLILAGLGSTLLAVWRGSLDLLPKGVTRASFMDGRVTKTMADSLARAPMPSEAARIERGWSWMAVGDLGPRVRQGCPGWLFLADELTPYAHAQDNAAARIRDVIDVRNELAKRHIALIVAVVPDKSRMEAANLCGLHRAASMSDRLSTWAQGLAAADIPVVNTEPTLAAVKTNQDGTRAFLRTDTHWNEQGAEQAAQTVAERVRGMLAAMKVQATPSVDYTLSSSRAPRPGDLVRLAGVEWLPLAKQPAPETARSTVFTATTHDDPKSADAADDLFGDDQLPNIALVGTSFSRTSNFVPFLENALHTRIGNFAKDGGDFAGAAHDYFAGPAFKETPPKLLIWEIPERVIQAPRDPAPIWPAGSVGDKH